MSAALIRHSLFVMLEILYDDGPCLVINKPSGVLTQAPAGIDSLEIQIKQFFREREPARKLSFPGHRA